MKESPTNERFRNIETIEESIHTRLNALPPDIREQWDARYNRASDEELEAIEQELAAFIQRREAALYHRPHIGARDRPAQCSGDAGVVRGDPVGPVEGLHHTAD